MGLESRKPARNTPAGTRTRTSPTGTRGAAGHDPRRAVRPCFHRRQGPELRARAAWRELLDKAARRKVDLIVVWRIDRAFRSVLDAATTLERLRAWGVGLRSYSEPWLDTTSPFGEALYYITVAYAQLERGILTERVKAGMERARREGRRIGRPPVLQDPARASRWEAMRGQVARGELSVAAAARALGVSRRTVGRLLKAPGQEGDGQNPGRKTSG
jgi:DNA invertase Pin-like site-specific DNA recombinase